MSFKEIFCQDRAVTILQRAFVTDKIAHAYIFAGLDGVGKFKTAHQWAKLLLCKSPIIEKNTTEIFADSCDSCESCRAFEVGSHPDFNYIYKELLEFTREGRGKSTPVELPIDVIREFLIEKVSIKPSLSHRKVFVVSEAEKLNASSQNALLKVLEEPPGYCCIILLCTRLERLLPTTRSRCQIIRFGPIDEVRIIGQLKQMGIEDKQAQFFARLCQGRLGAACQWANLELAGSELYQTKKKIVDSLADYKLNSALELAGEFLDESRKIADVWSSIEKQTSKTDINRKAQKTLIQMIIAALYDAMELNVTEQKKIINFDQRKQIEKFAVRFIPEQATEKITDCYRTIRWIESGVNEKLVFEQLLLNLIDSGIMKI